MPIISKLHMNLKIRKLICVPIAAAAFLCILAYSHRRESVHAAELSKVLAETVALSDGAVKVEVRNPENFQATAYCVTGITKSGVPVAPGHVAVDPRVIPLGSLIYIESASMGGIYHVTDTGRLIKGKIIDIFVPSYEDSIEFGRRNVKVEMLRYGYEDEAS